MTPDPFREALDAYRTACREAKDDGSARWGFACDELLAAEAAARLEVERLYAARVGGERKVENGYISQGGESGVGHFYVCVCGFAEPGDRVFVTKGEAG